MAGLWNWESVVRMAMNVNGIMKVPYYRETKKGDYRGEKSYVMAEMIPTSMAQYCIQWNADM